MKKKSKKRKNKKWQNIKKTKYFDPGVFQKVAKVRITTFVDSDVLNQLKLEASENEEGYQTLLNRIVREYFKGENNKDAMLQQILVSINDLKANVEFQNHSSSGSETVRSDEEKFSVMTVHCVSVPIMEK